MNAPVFVDEDGDISMYSTIGAAESHLEAQDVIANAYIVYDRNGEMLRQITVENQHATVLVKLLPSGEFKQEDLTRKLLNILNRIHADVQFNENSALSDIVAFCIESRILQWTWDTYQGEIEGEIR